MDTIKIIEVQSKSDLKKFIKFPLDLYKGNTYYVPPILSDEIKNFDNNENPAFEFSTVKCFLAYINNKIVGRIAGIINQNDEKLLNDKKLRFGWFDFIENIEVCKKLIETVTQLAKENNIHKIEGPVGFTNLDKAGMLTIGFKKVATLIGLYNYEYYPKYLEQLGLEKENHWIEYELKFNKHIDPKVEKFSTIITQRYNLKLINFLDKKKSDLLDYADKILDLLEESYKTLPSFIPFTKRQKEYYKKKYFEVLSKDLILCIEDGDGNLVGFSIVMYDYSKALQKANGKLFPFGWYHLLNATKNNNSVHFYLIGVKPEYQKKGLTALIWGEMHKIFLHKNIKFMETNPQLIENKSVQQLFKDYNPTIHKERKTYTLKF